jgi:tetratricopeptide (TPR) repeat protein
VLGTDFSLTALTPLIPDEARPFAGRHLEALERRELIRSSPRSLSGKETFRFRHDLIQLAAYRSMTKDTRAKLHQRVAQWFEDEAALGTPEFEEIVGYHLEQAHNYRRELGQLDAQARALGVRAGEQLASAGIRAFARFDVAAAENLLSRAKALLPDDHALASKLRRNLAETYEVTGRHADADAMLAELLEEARVKEDSRLERSIRLERARIRLATGPDPISLDAIREEAERALEVFEGTGDQAGLAQGCHVLGLVHLRLGELREMEEVARRGLAHAERSESAREELGARWSVSMALVAGATPVQACIRSCRELVRWRGTENPGVLADLAVLRSMLGDLDEARELMVRARRMHGGPQRWRSSPATSPPGNTSSGEPSNWASKWESGIRSLRSRRVCRGSCPCEALSRRPRDLPPSARTMRPPRASLRRPSGGRQRPEFWQIARTPKRLREWLAKRSG